MQFINDCIYLLGLVTLGIVLLCFGMSMYTKWKEKHSPPVMTYCVDFFTNPSARQSDYTPTKYRFWIPSWEYSYLTRDIVDTYPIQSTDMLYAENGRTMICTTDGEVWIRLSDCFGWKARTFRDGVESFS